MATYILTVENDTFSGTTGSDQFYGPSGGNDLLYGYGGDDLFQFEADAAGHVSGGSGNDTLDALGINLGSLSLSHIETLDLTTHNDLYATAAQLKTFSTITASNGSLYDTFHITGAGGRVDFSTNWSGVADLHVDASAATAAVTIIGSSGNDTITGSLYADTLAGKDGNDVITANGDKSIVYGGTGNDTLYGVGANSVIRGGTGSDILHASGYGVTLYGGGDADTLYANADHTTLSGGGGNDTFYDIYSGVITLTGGAGDDTINMYDCGCGSGTVDGGAGSDQAIELGIDLGGRVFTNVETLVLAYAPALYGSVDQFNSFQYITSSNGSPVNALIVTGAGGTLDMSARWIAPSYMVIDASQATSAMTITGTQNADVITSSYHADAIYAGAGADYVYVFGQLSNVHADAGNDTIYIYTDYAFVHGGADDDLIVDFYGTSQLYGEGGNDTFILYANPDSSIVSGGDGTDTVSEYGTSLGDRAFTSVENLHLDQYNYVTAKGDQLDAFAHITDDSGIGTATTIYVVGVGYAIDFSASWFDASRTLTVDASGGGVGSGFDLTGSSLSDVIIGSNYNDTIRGGGGDDAIYGGTGTNILRGGHGNDTMHAEGTNDLLAGGTGNDTLIDDSAGSSTLLGGDDDDTLTGGAGADVLSGDAGADTFVFNTVSDSDGINYDRVTGFQSGTDVFDLWFSVTGVDTSVTTGALNKLTFTSDLAAAVDFTSLHENHAILFTPDSGNLAGHTFMIVDVNGAAGYQAGQDLVVRVDGVASLDVGDFI